MSEIKFTKEELEKINSIQSKYEEYSSLLGRLELESIALNVRKEGVKVEVENLQKSEIDLAADLKKKYGDGILNPQTGIFTPQK